MTTCPQELPFGEPPAIRARVAGTDTFRLRSKRDLLCIEHVRMLNAGLCAYIRHNCGDRETWPAMCQQRSQAEDDAHVLEARLAFTQSCDDEHAQCSQWAKMGECTNNPRFMVSACAVSCDACGGPPREVVERYADSKEGAWDQTGLVFAPEGASLGDYELTSLLRKAHVAIDPIYQSIAPVTAPASGAPLGLGQVRGGTSQAGGDMLHVSFVKVGYASAGIILMAILAACLMAKAQRKRAPWRGLPVSHLDTEWRMYDKKV